MKKIMYILLIAMLLVGTVAATSLRDRFLIRDSDDSLAMFESIGNVKGFLTEDDLQILESRTFPHNFGNITTTQTINFTDQGLASPYISYTEDRDDYVSDYLRFDSGLPFLAYHINFQPEYSSQIQDNIAVDYLNDKLYILGEEYTILSATTSQEYNILKLGLVNEEVYDVLHEGDTNTYTIEGEDYEITVMEIYEIQDQECAKFSVNGEVTPQICERQTSYLNNGMPLSVGIIMMNQNDAIVSFYLGGIVVAMKDIYDDDEFYPGVNINGEEYNDVSIRFHTRFSTYNILISQIDYVIEADDVVGRDILLRPGETLSSHMQDPEVLLGNTWDFEYRGLTPRRSTETEFISGEHYYHINFNNKYGIEHTIPFVNNVDGLHYGDAQNTLWFTEPFSYNFYPIHNRDFFVLTPDDNTTNITPTNVFRYIGIDIVDKVISFEDVATGVEMEAAYEGTLGYDAHAQILASGYTYDVFIGNENSNYGISVDLDSDGTIFLDEVNIITQYGARIDLGQQEIVGNQVNAEYITPNSMIEEQDEDEVITLDVTDMGFGLYLTPNYNNLIFYGGENLPEGEVRTMTEYGNLIKFTPDTYSTVIDTPEKQRFALAFVLGEGNNLNQGSIV